MNVSAVIPAAGKGTRLGASVPKAFVPVHGKPLFIHTLETLSRSFRFREIIVATEPKHSGKAEAFLRRFGHSRVRVVAGGKTRAESVWNALEQVSGSSDWVLVHDAARPLVSKKTVVETINAARKSGGALCVFPVSSTVKRVKAGKVAGTEDRSNLFLAQTPQVFRKDLLHRRYLALKKKAFTATDEAALFDGSSVKVAAVIGNGENIKITTKGDLDLFKLTARKGRK